MAVDSEDLNARSGFLDKECRAISKIKMSQATEFSKWVKPDDIRSQNGDYFLCVQ